MPGGLSDELASLLSRSTDVNLPYDSREALMDMLLQVGVLISISGWCFQS
jgi:hypothetical protein